MVARLLISKEKFILSSSADVEEDDLGDILNSKGLHQTVKESKHSIGVPAITEDQLLKNLESPDYEELKAFKVRY